MKANLSRQITNKPVSATLVFWLSGLMFLFCCEMPTAQAAKADSCPLAKKNHCAKEYDGKSVSQFASLQTDDRKLDCCRVLTNIFDKARKVESNPQTAKGATSLKISLPKFSIVKSDFKVSKFYHPPVLDRGGAYLRNRVLRI